MNGRGFKVGFLGLGLAIIGGWSGPALACHPLITDDTGTQGVGVNQIEVGYDYDRSTLDGVTDGGHSLPITYTRGVTEELDLFLGVARLSSPVRGWGNAGLGAKWRFYDNEASGLSLGLEPKIQLPVSGDDEAKGLGNGKTSYSLAFLATQNTSFGLVLVNLAAGQDNFADDTMPDRKTTYRLSVAPLWQVSDVWRLALDMGVMTNPDRSQKYRMGYMELGAIYSPNQNLDLSLGVIRGVMDGPVQNTTVTSEVTWRF
jgi:hypothetical protein